MNISVLLTYAIDARYNAGQHVELSTSHCEQNNETCGVQSAQILFKLGWTRNGRYTKR
jgi:hypothetical protein